MGFCLIANLGPGARDGLIIGVQKIIGKPVALIRAKIEVSVFLVGD